LKEASMLKLLQKKSRKPASPPTATIEERLQVYRQTNPGLISLTAEAIGQEMKALSTLFDDYPPYFDCLYNDYRYMRPFVGKTGDFILNTIHNPTLSVLDVCGGCGSLGLYLALGGHHGYTLADITPDRMKWGALLWERCGQTLTWQKEDARALSFPHQTFDIVTLLGWEAPTLPYSYQLKECLRVLNPGGWLIFTYHEMDELIEGNWDFDPERQYSYLPYAISRSGIYALCELLGLEVVQEEASGHPLESHDFFPDATPRALPQYILYCRKK